MKIHPVNLFKIFPPLSALVYPAVADGSASRELTIRSLMRDGENHVSIRASALESTPDGTFPITTLDKNAFKIVLDNQIHSDVTIGLTTFDMTRRINNRAVVWAYDATGVTTMKGLNKDLRTLSAQEFAPFDSDFLSILGVSTSRTFERVSVDPKNQDNTLALQRRLLGDPSGISADSVFTAHPFCVALQKFEKWTSSGLKSTDQKSMVLVGGASSIREEDRVNVESCLARLVQMQVSIHQIIFARTETFLQRHWTRNADALATGSIFRVVDMQGASRALTITRNILDKEYIVNAQIPPNRLSSRLNIALQATYHGAPFQSSHHSFDFSDLTNSGSQPNKGLRLDRYSPPPKVSVLENKKSLTLTAWVEWMVTAFLIGGTVTLRHMKRMNYRLFDSDRVTTSTSHNGPKIRVLSGRNEGHEFPIANKKIIFGRGILCDVRLNDPLVKRVHCSLSFLGDKALLEDLSKGNLAVNGRPLRHMRVIGHGSVIQLGETQLLFQCGET